MTAIEEKKQIKRTNQYRSAVIGILTAIATTVCVAVVKYLPIIKDAVDNRTFKTVEDRVNTEIMLQIFNETNGFEDLKEHVHNPGVHMPKESKDSSYVRREEFEDLMSNMAIDNYNQKRTSDNILEKVEYQNRILDIMYQKLNKIENR